MTRKKKKESTLVEPDPPSPTMKEGNTRTVTPKTGVPQTLAPIKPTMAEVVKGNRSQQLALKLDYYPPVLRDGLKVVKLNQTELEMQNQKWRSALIGYVIGGNLPSNKCSNLSTVSGIMSTLLRYFCTINDILYSDFIMRKRRQRSYKTNHIRSVIDP